MAVPNTNTFSLQDVVNEINPTTDDLLDCINDANSALYDPNYYTAPATSLLEFRNYGAANLLTVTTESTLGIPPIPFASVGNQSTINQTFTFTWKYVGQVSDINTTVSYDGINRSPGYTTPILSQTFNEETPGGFYVPFALNKGNNAEVEFEFTLITASVDIVPNAPDNKTTVYIFHNF
jgi:hypothetical protein